MSNQATEALAQARAKEPETVILVVEDEHLVRFSVAEYLRACDFHVLEAVRFGQNGLLNRSGVAGRQ